MSTLRALTLALSQREREQETVYLQIVGDRGCAFAAPCALIVAFLLFLVFQ